MRPNGRFLAQPRDFWAIIRQVSQKVGYTERGKGRVKAPTMEQALAALTAVGLSTDYLVGPDGTFSLLGMDLIDYLKYRADVLNHKVEPLLMDAQEAKELFEEYHSRLDPSAPIPMNKQKGDKRAPAYLTGLINMVVESAIGEHPCDYDPRELTTVTRDGRPLRTLARWVDGAFPAATNPVAVWEIKEYYYTTTFGSRVADGVYESLLDGMELEELHKHEGIKVLHYLMVDSHFTWWKSGKSYLCRIVDMLHMGYVDEVLFGREVVTELPRIVDSWLERLPSPMSSPAQRSGTAERKSRLWDG